MKGPDLEAEAKEIAKIGYADPVFFLRFFLQEWFPDTIPWFHRGILAILCKRTDFLHKYGELDLIFEHFRWKENPDDDQSPEWPIFIPEADGSITLVDNKFFALKLPRGFAKTTLLNGYTIWATAYRERKFIVYISETSTHAEMQLGSVRAQFEVNDKLNLVFGALAPGQRQGKKWTDAFIETTNGVCVAARGRGAQIRGLNHNGQRPDFLLFDDIEDKESVKTDEQRDKAVKWFYNDALPALPRRDLSAGGAIIGTLLHAEALLKRIESDPRFHCVTFSCVDRRGSPLWPEHMPMEEIEKEKRAAAAVGELSGFYMEYYNLLRNEETATFKARYIIYEAEDLTKVPFRAMACDPAISQKKRASHFTLACVGMSEKGVLHVLDVWGDIGVPPREQVNRYFAMHKRWNPQYAGVESIAYQAALVHLLREEMFRYGRYFEITEIKGHDLKKEDRIQGILQPRYASGYVRHRRRFPELETQLLDFPNGQMDYADVVAMAVALLDPYAAQAANPEIDLAADEYEPLSIEYRGDWRPM